MSIIGEKKEGILRLLVISDSVLATSGVGIQTKQICDALMKTGKVEIIQLAGAAKHIDTRPIKIDAFDNDFTIIPVEGFGDQDLIRSVVHDTKPDMIYIMTDPRYFNFLFEIEHEIRPFCPIVYNTIWDAEPTPKFNKYVYESVDVSVAISKVTHECIKNLNTSTDLHYIPHVVDPNVFRKYSEKEMESFYEKAPVLKNDKFKFFFNSRNFRRKHPGTIIYWFSKFLKECGNEKVQLVMKTNPLEQPAGQNLFEVCSLCGLNDGEVVFIADKLTEEDMAKLYNTIDCTVFASDAEGFGLGCLESLACGKLVVSPKTGGLQDQIRGSKEDFGVLVEPKSRYLIGSLDVPYIFEDRMIEEDFIQALRVMYLMPENERKELGERAQKHVNKNFNYNALLQRWVELIFETHKKCGSWDTRKGYQRYRLVELEGGR